MLLKKMYQVAEIIPGKFPHSESRSIFHKPAFRGFSRRVHDLCSPQTENETLQIFYHKTMKYLYMYYNAVGLEKYLKKLHLPHKYATHLDPVAINRHNMFMNKEVFLFGHRFLFLTKTSSVMQIVIICLWLCPNLFFNKSRCGLSLFSSSGL